MLNVDIGGAKGNASSPVKDKWKILDIREKETDYFYDLNSLEPFPFKDNEVDNYFSSMTLESVHLDKIQFVVNEIYRTLKSKGKIRITVPDISYAMRLYLENPEKLKERKYPKADVGYPDLPIIHFLSWIISDGSGKNKYCNLSGHKIALDKESLIYYFCKAGFEMEKIEWLEYGKCSDVFNGRDRTRWAGWSLYMEVEK